MSGSDRGQLVLDRYTRGAVAVSLDPMAKWLSERSVNATHLTITGFIFGLAACGAVASGHWSLGLILWLSNRIFDGLDGLVARSTTSTDLGGFLDLISDFTIYSGFVVAIAIAVPEARLVSVVLLTSYYISGTAFLTWSSLSKKQAAKTNTTDRSLKFLPGLAEGTETIIVYCVICLVPSWTIPIMWSFAGTVFVTAIQRIWWATRTL